VKKIDLPPGKEYDAAARKMQTKKPSIPVDELWANGIYPVGELHDYVDNNLFRTTSVEMREKDRLFNDEWNMVRQAAECHRQVRQWAQTQIKPGCNLYDVCEGKKSPSVLSSFSLSSLFVLF
jgi:methionyl aminopeptidase